MKTRLIFLSIIVLTFAGCKKKAALPMVFQYIAGPSIADPNGDDFLIFSIKTTNLSDDDIIVNDKIENINDPNYHLSKESGFYLISDKISGGIIKLNEDKASDISIKAGKSEEVFPHLYIDVLERHLIMNDDKRKIYDYTKVKKFLNEGNYSIIYISLKDLKSSILPKSNKFKPLFTDSQDTIRILKNQFQ